MNKDIEPQQLRPMSFRPGRIFLCLNLLAEVQVHPKEITDKWGLAWRPDRKD